MASKISPSQARMLAEIWVGRYPRLGWYTLPSGYNTPTLVALKARACIDISEPYHGATRLDIAISPAGFAALAAFLTKEATKGAARRASIKPGSAS